MKIPSLLKTGQNTVSVDFSSVMKVMAVLLIASACLFGCARKKSDDVRIELEALDGRDVSDSDAVFPTFISKDEVFQKELDKLNKESEKIRRNYEERRQKDKQFIVHTYVNPAKNVPQCTLFWYEEHSLLGDDYNLMTLAYNKNTGMIMTSKEALDSLDIDGVTLSTNVGKLFRDLHPSLELKRTEMQGFETDESGAVTRVFMKLVAQKIPEGEGAADEEAEEEIHFYSYDPAADTLILLSQIGYEIP